LTLSLINAEYPVRSLFEKATSSGQVTVFCYDILYYLISVNFSHYTPCPQKVSQIFFAITLKIVHKFPSKLAGSCKLMLNRIC